MSFSFAPAGQPPQNSTTVPALVVPEVPTIATAVAAPEPISPFAFRNRNKSKFSVYFQGAIFLAFTVVVAATVGIFAYRGYLKSMIETKKQELETKQSSFKKLPLDDMIKITNRLKVVNQTIKKQASVRTAFLLLESGVENPVTYSKFSLSFSESKKVYTLNLSADAPSYHTMIQQIETFRDPVYKNYFSNIEISRPTIDEKGNGSFVINTTVNLQGVLPETFSLTASSTAVATTTNEGVGSLAPSGALEVLAATNTPQQ
jgi:hypothetical protein